MNKKLYIIVLNISFISLISINIQIYAYKNRRKKQLENNKITKSYDTTLETFNMKPIIFSSSRKSEQKILSMNLTNIEFTQPGLIVFLNTTFNRDEYAQEILPHTFSHMIQFLNYSYQANQSKEFVEGSIRLFNQKIKSAPFINAQAYEKMLHEITPILAYFHTQNTISLYDFSQKTMLHTFKNKCSSIEYQFTDLFNEIGNSINNYANSIQTTERLRAITIRFLIGCLDKIIWCPDDQIKTWNSFKNIGTLITNLYHQKIITDIYDLNDMYWSLVERYCYFLDLTGSGLSLDVCNAMKNDIINNTIHWIKLAEQESYLNTKQDKLIHSIIKTEAKIHAYQAGISTDIF